LGFVTPVRRNINDKAFRRRRLHPDLPLSKRGQIPAENLLRLAHQVRKPAAFSFQRFSFFPRQRSALISAFSGSTARLSSPKSELAEVFQFSAFAFPLLSFRLPAAKVKSYG
jgi:hypothetical protein